MHHHTMYLRLHLAHYNHCAFLNIPGWDGRIFDLSETSLLRMMNAADSKLVSHSKIKKRLDQIKKGWIK